MMRVSFSLFLCVLVTAANVDVCLSVGISSDEAVSDGSYEDGEPSIRGKETMSRTFHPCGDGKCECASRMADCSGHAETLTYIPRLPVDLKSLDFSYNGLTAIQENFFLNVTNITRLELTDNGLKTVAPGAFGRLRRLSFLDVSDNYLTYDILQHILVSAKHLAMLLVNGNNLGAVPDLFFAMNPLPRLRKLSLIKNNIVPLDLSVFAPLTALRHLILSNNNPCRNIVTHSLPGLRKLELGNLGVTSFPETCQNDTSLFPNLVFLDLSRNKINSLAEEICLPNLTSLYLSGNAFYELVPDMFGRARFPVLHYLHLNSLEILLAIKQYTFRNSSVRSLSLNSNNLPFGNNDVVHEGMFDGCDDLQRLEIIQNDLSDVSDERLSRLLGTLHKLQHLDSSYSRMNTISPRTFKSLKSLSRLVLGYNKLTELPSNVFDALSNLRSLSLNGNSISVVKESAFGKQIREQLIILDMSGNPFECSCDLQWFRNWLTSDINLFSHSTSTYMCQNIPNTTVQLFHQNQQACLLSQPTSLFISVSVAMVMTILTLASLFHRYRWHIRLVLYEAFRGRGDRWRRLQERNFRCDVFVSYDGEDLDWVLTHLMPRLEGEMGLRLCLHQRDFIPGNNIVDNIVECVENSKKIVMLFSSNFSSSPWCQFELNLCLGHVLENDDMLLVVMLHDIPSRDLTPAMMAVMKTTTYIEWFDHPDATASFWGRMQIALTDVLPNVQIL